MDLPHTTLSLRTFWLLLHHLTLLSILMNLFCIAECMTHHLKDGKTKTDQLALLAFKNKISDDPRGVFQSWNNSVHLCKWGGVTCGRRNPERVAALNLTGLSLVGSLTPYIANLSFLQSIDLSSNSFHGQIPQEIGHLFRLRYVNLSFNSFDGEIPKNLTHCLKLRVLDLDANELSGKIPFEVGYLSKLESLVLSKNNIMGEIPTSLGNITSLTVLDLSRNSLDGSISANIGQLVNLGFLALAENKLSGMIPPSVYNLSSIFYFDVSLNDLNGSLPPELGLTLPNLRVLYVRGNRFTGQIPISLGNASNVELLDFNLNKFIGHIPEDLRKLQNLRRFNIEDNQLGGKKDDDLTFITSLTNCSGLQTLALGQNQFSGILPHTIANLSTKLRQLSLGRNQIFGTIPREIENLASLILLSMGDNLLTGTIPIQLGKLQKLEVVYLHRNRFSGDIPSSLGNLTRLYELSLYGNDLHGSIPKSLGNCQDLQQLLLSENNLSGTIPEHVLTAPTLRKFDVGMNSLNGSLQLDGSKLQSLLLLNVSNNKLSGEIPVNLGSCSRLESLHMEGNFFQGSIPSSFASLKGIQELDLSHNNLSGLIPKGLKILRYLNLSFNDLEGEVPEIGIFQNASVISVLGNSRLCGGASKLQLPKCHKKGSRKHGRAYYQRIFLSEIIIIGLVLMSCLLASCYWFIRRNYRFKRRKPTESFCRVTYIKLYAATNGFSSTNLTGAGGSSSVYRGFLEDRESEIAVKVFKLQHQRVQRSFFTECKIMRNIRHRNIPSIYTACSTTDLEGNDFKALVFPYIPNGNLHMWLHPNVNEQHQLRYLDLSQRLNIAIDVANVLEYLHSHCQEPIVHCDIKPSNILLDNDMVAYVADFGIAKVLSRRANYYSQTEFSFLEMKGSIGYIAPEYGMGGKVSIKWDVYSYGILLLEMLTGRRPIDPMFKDNLSLHQFAKMALHGEVMDIIDRRMLSEIKFMRYNENYNKIRSRMQECIASMVRIGVYCSAESPNERMDIRDVVMELEEVRRDYLENY